MRVIIDARSFNKGGEGSILLGILENLDYSKNEYTIIGDVTELSKLNLPCTILNNKSKAHSLTGYINYNLAKEINLYDCYFTPTYIIPRGININTYCLFTDTLFFDKSKFSKRRFTDFIKRKVAKRSFKKAKKIFTVSKFTKSRLQEIFKKPKDIEVIRPGVCKAFEIEDNIDKNPKNYLAFVGSLKRHKNLDTLLLAMQRSKCQYNVHIILQDKNLRRKDYKTIKKLSKNTNIKILINLKINDYIKEIKNAKALIQPSIYEGYASALLEAKKLRTPIIASDIPPHREIFSENEVIFFSPQSVDNLTDILISKEFKVGDFAKEEKFSNNISTRKIVKSFEKRTLEPHLRRNFAFNVIYQLLVVLTPLITIPYISRILGASSLGKFSFAYTTAFYFIIFGYLGFQQYAQRAIAEVKNDRVEQSKRFWQIVIIRLIPVAISLGALFTLYITNVFGEYKQLILIFSIIVASTALDINFFFHGKENFFIVMILNLIIRVLFLISVFTFIKSSEDINLYAVLYSLMVFGGYISMWVMLPTNLRKVRLNTLDFKKHMKASLGLFLPVAAISIYAILDKTLIGVLVKGDALQRVGYITILVKKADLQNGYYYQTDKIIKALLSILLAFGAVMTTRNTIEYSNKHIGSVKKNVYKSFRFTFALGVPMALGTVAIANSFVPVFFGNFYEEVAILLMLYAPVILLSGTSNIIGMQYLLPTKRDKPYAISVLIGFAINLLLNCLFIPFMGARGAIVGTIISEFFIAFIQLVYISKEISMIVIFKIIWKYLVAGIVMCLVCSGVYYFIFDLIETKNLFNLIILIPLGVLVYYFVLLILRDKQIFKYTKLYLIKIGRFFKFATNKTIVQGMSFVLTVFTTEHSNRILNRQVISNYKELKDEEIKENGKERKH